MPSPSLSTRALVAPIRRIPGPASSRHNCIMSFLINALPSKCFRIAGTGRIVFRASLNFQSPPPSKDASGDSLPALRPYSLGGPLPDPPSRNEWPDGSPDPPGLFFCGRPCHSASTEHRRGCGTRNFSPTRPLQCFERRIPSPLSASTPWADLSGIPVPERMARRAHPGPSGFFPCRLLPATCCRQQRHGTNPYR